MNSLKFAIMPIGKVIVQRLCGVDYKDYECCTVSKIVAENSPACLYALQDAYSLPEDFDFVHYTGYKVFACLDDLKTFIECEYLSFDDGLFRVSYDGDFE